MGKKEASKEKDKEKLPRTRYEELTDQVYNRIDWFAKRFITISVVGIIVGFEALIYGIFAYYSLANPITAILGFQMPPLQDLSVFLGIQIGFVSLVLSLVLIILGIFWKIQVKKRTIF